MIKKAFELAKSLGYKAVFLCSDPQFYCKIGYVPTCEHNIYHITDTEKMPGGAWYVNCLPER